MFTCIKLKNFKSFKDVTLDLCHKKNTPKNLAVIYGINGSGKTTIAEAFVLLNKTMKTMEIRGMLNDILNEKSTPPDDFPIKQNVLLQMLKKRLLINDVENLINSYKMIDSSENMSIEYEFVIDGNPGSYYIEMDNTSITKERLEYKLSKRRGCYFNLEDDEISINSKIFESRDFYNLIKQQAKMYWGKHSMLSILKFEMADKSDTFINSNISNNLMDVILFLSGIQYKLIGERDQSSSNDLLANLQSGTIDRSEEKQLSQVEVILDSIFKNIFNDIVKVFYQRNINDEKIEYQLYLRKQIAEKEFNINFNLESSGTKEILKLLPFFVAAAAGKCVVIDEYGTRIHDILSSKLLESVGNQITGQMIITTHNTMIMESPSLDPESLYFIMEDMPFNKSIKCITEIEERLHPKHNYRTRYLSNDLYKSSMPVLSENIDLSGLVSLFSSSLVN